MVRITKPITLATAKAVGAGNSCKQDDIIVAANMGRKAVSDLLTTCKVWTMNFLVYQIHGSHVLYLILTVILINNNFFCF